MKLYLIQDENYGAIKSACWTRPEPGVLERVTEIELPPIVTLVDNYYEFRGYLQPDYVEAFLWLVSEVGELAGAIATHLRKGWVRNHEHKETMPGEIGDVQMMLAKFAQQLGIDPVDAMIVKWITKGWNDGNNTEN